MPARGVGASPAEFIRLLANHYTTGSTLYPDGVTHSTKGRAETHMLMH
jgi:hypothetical protein